MFNRVVLVAKSSDNGKRRRDIFPPRAPSDTVEAPYLTPTPRQLHIHRLHNGFSIITE